MKKILDTLLFLLFLILLTACKKQAPKESAKIAENKTDFSISAPAADSLPENFYAPTDFTPDSSTSALVAKKNQPSSSGKIDYDLSRMNYNMISAVTFDMAMNPEKYLGKKVRISGLFFSLFDEEAKTRFYACIVYDSTACCQIGIDFIMSKNKTYPDDFPKEEAPIQITGTFTTQKVGEIEYNCLLCDEITLL